MADPVNPDKDILAAELVMGLLDSEEKADALRLQLSDPEFAKNIEQWRTRIDPMFQEYDDVIPPSSVWKKIDGALNIQVSGQDNDAIITKMKSWRMGAMGSGALAAGLAFALLVNTDITAPIDSASPPIAVAQLTGDIDGLVLAVSYNTKTAEMKVDVDGMPETETEPEIWIVDKNGVFRSLGQIGRDGISEMIVPSEHRGLIMGTAKLALTMEPASETPHEKPSGEAVASGKITFI